MIGGCTESGETSDIISSVGDWAPVMADDGKLLAGSSTVMRDVVPHISESKFLISCITATSLATKSKIKKFASLIAQQYLKDKEKS